MKTDSKPLIAVCGALTIGVFGFALVQLVPVLTGASANGQKQAASSAKATPILPDHTKDIPVVTSDPFQALESAPLPTAAATGPQTGTAQSAPVVSNPPIQGSIGNSESLPNPQQGNTESPNGEQVAAPNLTVGFRGVIMAEQTKAYIAVHGKPAKPFALGATILEGVVLFNIQDNFIELKSGEEIIRLRVGQEVQL